MTLHVKVLQWNLYRVLTNDICQHCLKAPLYIFRFQLCPGRCNHLCKLSIRENNGRKSFKHENITLS